MVPLRSILFRLHWALGLTAGLVLALMGATGALMSYEDEIGARLNRDLATVAPGKGPRLSPEALVARLEAQRPGLRVATLTFGDPETAPLARFAPDARTRERPGSVFLDPADGAIRGEALGEETFAAVRRLHRWLLLPGDGKGWGRTVTTLCAIALLIFLATGLVLRWPKLHTLRIWLRPSLKRPGRPRWWSLHAVAGTWLAPVYLASALTGLWWSSDVYKAAVTTLLTGRVPAERPGRAPGRSAALAPGALDRAWETFRAGEGRAASLAILTLPGPDAPAIRIRYVAADAAHPSARSEMTFDVATGALRSASRYEDKALGERMVASMLEVHRGRFFGPVTAFIVFLAALALPVFAATGLTLYVLRRRARRARSRAPAAKASAPGFSATAQS